MSKPKCHPIGIRLPPAARVALERAAMADYRPVSALAAKIVVDWLQARGELVESSDKAPIGTRTLGTETGQRA